MTPHAWEYSGGDRGYGKRITHTWRCERCGSRARTTAKETVPVDRLQKPNHRDNRDSKVWSNCDRMLVERLMFS